MGTELATDIERRVADSINAERAAAGLDPLKVEVHLNDAAQSHSQWMAETGTFSHEGDGGSSSTERIEDADFPLEGTWQTAENIAYTSLEGGLDAGEVDAMHARLMGSDGHRANMLDPDAAYVGIGLAVGSIEGFPGDVAFLTEDFANTDGEVLVEEEVDGETVLQSYRGGEAVGAPRPVTDDDDPDTPADPDDDDPDRDRPTDPGSGCFVATAAYGDRNHPDVVALRRFRDTVLVQSPAGRAFVRAYAVAGPRLARVVSPDAASGRIARALIAPIARRVR